MLPFVTENEPELDIGDYILVLGVRNAVETKTDSFEAVVIKENGQTKPLSLKVSALTDDERQIILDGCLINYYRG